MSRDRCVISHVNSACSATYSVHDSHVISALSHPLLGETPEELFPICTPGASDSASFDEVAELLWLSGRPITEAVMMMIPEAWENHATMAPARKAFYEYHSLMMEPWDGPAAVS